MDSMTKQFQDFYLFLILIPERAFYWTYQILLLHQMQNKPWSPCTSVTSPLPNASLPWAPSIVLVSPSTASHDTRTQETLKLSEALGEHKSTPWSRSSPKFNHSFSYLSVSLSAWASQSPSIHGTNPSSNLDFSLVMPLLNIFHSTAQISAKAGLWSWSLPKLNHLFFLPPWTSR